MWGDKVVGLIVDYIGVFRNLQQALAIYGTTFDGQFGDDDSPVKDKGASVDQLRCAVEEAHAFCVGRQIDLPALNRLEAWDFIRARDLAVDALVTTEESKRCISTSTIHITARARAFTSHRLPPLIQPHIPSFHRFSQVKTHTISTEDFLCTISSRSY